MLDWQLEPDNYSDSDESPPDDDLDDTEYDSEADVEMKLYITEFNYECSIYNELDRRIACG